ncbi:L-serine ammonia-lyase, iron-sulfur-dependent, subunit alpha [bacterium]|nr:L-serine ammonia-lyase, iron-sulfur-dependent, subunit alpha [bacterium]
MKFISIFNDVLGPVMRGPSSSHTAGSYRIGRIARSLFGENPYSVTFTFDPKGSYAQIYRQQGVDLAFLAGLMEWSLTDGRFLEADSWAEKEGLKVKFEVLPLKEAQHPNTVKIEMIGKRGKNLTIMAKSTGGGNIEIYQVEEWPVSIDGKSYQLAVETEKPGISQIKNILSSLNQFSGNLTERGNEDKRILQANFSSGISSEVYQKIIKLNSVSNVWKSSPVFYMKKGESLFTNTQEMLEQAEKNNLTLGETGLSYEAQLLGMEKKEVRQEMERRFQIMKDSVKQGLKEKNIKMQLLSSSGGKIWRREKKGELSTGGIHTKAAARAMVALHINNSMGVVCAAPTGGASGVIPGVMVSLYEDRKFPLKKIIKGLGAASSIGLIVARRATFAAEEAGCQVEIGAAGAMGAAGVVEIAGGTPQQAVDAAAIFFQNIMGSVCDLVQGACEIPCHTRNAVAASSAYVCADLILGGYKNPIPLDETIDAVYSVGKMLPSELRCTSRGGIAVTPSAQSLSRFKRGKEE